MLPESAFDGALVITGEVVHVVCVSTNVGIGESKMKVYINWTL